MSDDSRRARLAGLRREPPAFRRVALATKTELSSRMIRVTLAGDQLDGLVVDEPASSVRLLLPAHGRTALEVPIWNGNEFLLADGSRPSIRTFTPPFKTAGEHTIDLDLVIHGSGAASAWARSAEPGAEVALSGPGRGFVVDPQAERFLLAGDETAIPAIRQLLTVLPTTASVIVHVEVAEPQARLDLGHGRHVRVEWHDLAVGDPPGHTLVGAVEREAVDTDLVVWAAGEAAAVHRIRGHLFGEAGLARSAATIRGYWKLRSDS